PRRLVTTDATVESIAPILASNPRGIVLVRDELVAWLKSFDMYRGGKGNDRQFFLSVWSGSGIRLDRKGSRLPLSVPRPFLGIVGGLVPNMIGELLEEQGRDDGMLDRLVFAYPDDPGLPSWSEEELSPDLQSLWADTLSQLWELTPARA